jgi:pimeloyl-ACP methyl ester carboxylesterase
MRAIAIEWRGCGQSERPLPDADFANYSLDQHANDLLAALDALKVGQCDLATHSTGGLIATLMLCRQPERFRRVLALDPVPSTGLPFDEQAVTFFEQARTDRRLARAALAGAAASLFASETLVPGRQPEFAGSTSEHQRQLFEHLVDQAMQASPGIWLGTPIHLNRLWQTWQSGRPLEGVEKLVHPHLILWGKLDPIIPLELIEHDVQLNKNFQKDILEEVGHSLNVEDPIQYARKLDEFLS